jgi:hypothetical protein
MQQEATTLGNEAKLRNSENYREIVKTLVPIAQQLAAVYPKTGITASNVRLVAINRRIINENTPLNFLSSVMKQAGLITRGETRPSSIPSTKGRRQLVYYTDTPYAQA